MEFLFLILVNIVLATIFYLIISLRLEKSAAGYREKRLKKEIDEIINEFNIVAERNISILENRIENLKLLLEKNGDICTIDISDLVEDENKTKDKNPQKEDKPLSKDLKDLTVKEESSPAKETTRLGMKGVLTSFLHICKKVLHITAVNFGKFRNGFNDFFKSILNKPEDSVNNHDISEPEESANTSNSKDKVETSNIEIEIIEKQNEEGMCFSPPLRGPTASGTYGLRASRDPRFQDRGGDLELSEGEILEMFIKSDDKYSLISELYKRGYSESIITRCSGLPIGEVKLVLDLSGPC